MKRGLLLGLIFFLALFLRLYHLNQVPPSLYWDEVSLGYNAYTISETGKDEHGTYLPLTYFAAFGDYKPPVYIYAIVPFIKLLGPTELAVRLPSALSGSFLVLVTFFLVKQILSYGNPKLKRWSLKIAFVTALFIAISPWSIQMSRAAFEANLATLLSGSGALFFLLAQKWKKVLYLVLSSIFFALTFYTFNSHRIFVPLLIIGLSLIFWRSLLTNWKKWLVFFVLGGMILLPLIPHMLSSEGKLRFNEVTWLKNVDLVVESNKKIAEFGNSPLANIVFNRRVFYAREFTKHFADHFKPDFLFVHGDVNPRLSTQSVGELYLIDALFFIAGILALIKFRSKASLIIFVWLITAPVPASFARETPHALRILNILPMPQLLCAIGLVWITKKLRILTLLIPICYLLSAWVYFQNYFLVYPKVYAESWQYGYKEVVQYVNEIESKYSVINVTPKYGRPHIYFLFYGKVLLEKYLSSRNAKKDIFGFWQVDSFGKYQFKEATNVNDKWLYVRLAKDTATIINKKTFNSPLGNPIFVVTEQL